MAPTAQFGGQPETPSRTLVEMNRNNMPSLPGPSVAPQGPVDKAFSGYHPTSGVSPYMNLFRIQGDTLNNYTSLVRPEVEQRFLNNQFGQDIRGLATQSRMQGVNLQQLYRTNETLQGVATPQYYMNTGSYYPQQ
jgi:hypothetical protein